MLHVEIVLKTKQPEAETSLVYDVFIQVIKSASWTSDERKRNGINVWSMWSVKKFYGLFVDTWNKGNIGLLHHVCNDHDWPGGSCDHGELPDDHSLPWFDRRTKDFEALQQIILDPALLESFKSYIKFRWTWSLTFHFSLIDRAVTKISRCRVHVISGQGLKQLWSSFGFVC